MRLFLILVSIAVNASTRASAFTKCPNALEKIGRFQVHKYMTNRGRCFLSVSDQMAPGLKDLTYRSYLFTDQGLMLVFVSAGEGPESQFTGSRTYHIFPRIEDPDYYQSPSKNLHIVMASKNEIVFSQKTGDIAYALGMDIQVDPNISLDNRGGVEILSAQTLILDSGWDLGRMSIEDRNRTSIFRRPFYPNCQFKNGKLFDTNSSGDVSLRFKTDSELSRFLHDNCPS